MDKTTAMIPENELKEIERMNDKVFSCYSELEELEKSDRVIPCSFLSSIGPMYIEFNYCAKLIVEKKYEQAVTVLNQYTGPYSPLSLNVKETAMKFKKEHTSMFADLQKECKNIDLVRFSVQDYEYALCLSYLWGEFGYEIAESPDFGEI